MVASVVPPRGGLIKLTRGKVYLLLDARTLQGAKTRLLTSVCVYKPIGLYAFGVTKWLLFFKLWPSDSILFMLTADMGIATTLHA